MGDLPAHEDRKEPALLRALFAGAAAGAAGTTALNAVTYADMALRAQSASTTPQQSVEKLSEQSGYNIPGDADERQNRIAGLGPLMGVATGVGVGVAAGLLRPVLIRIPRVLGSLLLGAAAMAAGDLPMSRLGVSDATSWSAADWVSDVLPHAAYGLVTNAVLRATWSDATAEAGDRTDA